MPLTSEAMTLDMRCTNCGKVGIAYLKKAGPIPAREVMDCPQCGERKYQAHEVAAEAQDGE